MLDFFRKLFRRWFGGPETPPPAAEPAAEPQAKPTPPPADAAPEAPATPPAASTPSGNAPQPDPAPIPAGDTAEATPVKPAPETAAPRTASPSSRDLPSEPATRTEPRLARAYDPHELRLDLVRYSHGPHDTLGRLYLNGEFVCYTHEAAAASDTRLPAGSYPLGLREAGGKHAAYAFRFPDMHQGMLWIKAEPDQPFALLHLGRHHSDPAGSIAVGLEVKGEADLSQPRELWFSPRAYRDLYLPVATALKEGQPGRIVVENAGD